jgi:WD40 repeat protein
MIESRPLQIYKSALIFSPEASVVRSLFKDYIPKWLHQMPTTGRHWDPLLQSFASLTGYDVAFSPDGKMVASTGGTIWDTSTGTLVKQLESSHGSTSVEFSEDGKGLISVTLKGKVMKWDVATGLLILEMSTGQPGTSIAVFSQNRNMVAIAGGFAGTIITFVDIVGERYVKRKSAHSRNVVALAISPDGACLASASLDDKEVYLWDTTTAKVRRTLQGHCDGVSTVAFSPNGRVLASADMNNNIYLWHAGTGAALATIGYSTIIECLAFSPDSSLLASTGRDGSLCLWEAATGAFLWKIDGDFRAPLFSPNGDFLTSITGTKGHTSTFTDGIRLWETESGRLAKVVTDFGYIVNKALFSPDGTILASASRTEIQLWDLTNDAKTTSCSGHARSVNSVALTSSAERAVSFAEHDSVMLWDVMNADLLSTISVADHSHSIMVLSPDGTLIAISRSGTNVEILDSRTGKLLRTLTGHIDVIHTMVFTPDSRFLASASLKVVHSPEHHRVWTTKGGYEQDNPDSPDASIRLWNAKTGELLHEFHGPPVYMNCLSFSIDGTFLAAGQDGNVHIWNARTGDFFKALEGHPDEVVGVAFSSDGKTVASACRDGKLRLWDVDTSEMTRVLQYTETIHLPRFSPNGKLLATVSFYDVQLWNPTTGELLAHFRANVNSMTFSKDSEYLNTNKGRLSIEMICPGLSNLEGLKHDPGIFVKEEWVFRGTEKILLLPPDYSATCASYRDGVLVVGHRNGRVSIMQFDQQLIATL